MPSELNPYELQRQQLIARNRARLQALGINSAATALQENVAKAPAKPKRKQQKKAAVSHEPTRHSSRLNPDAGEADSEASELALCIVNGTCPRCGKYVDVGHKRHLDQCSGSHKSKQGDTLGHVEIEGLDELEAEEEASLHGDEVEADTRPAKRSKPSKSQSEKLKELELSGLVDFDKSHARFAVIGSTGSHYNVELKDPAPSCQCVDYRIRKRICKHQKLVLLQLGIPDAPQDWYKAVSSKLDSLMQAEPTDRQLPLGEAEVDADHAEPAAESSKPAKPVATHGKAAHSTTGGRKSSQQHRDKEMSKGDSEKGGDSDVQAGQEEGLQDTAHESVASRGGLSPAGLAWPKRPPRGKYGWQTFIPEGRF